MLGHIIGIEENLVSVELNPEQTNQEMMNRHVILEDGRQVIGEIVDVKDGVAYVMLLGELKESKFVFGVVKKPSFQAKISFVPNNQIEYIIGISDYAEDKDLYIGKSPIYEDVNIGFRINDFFSSHFAIFGSTGSGKSCSIARILQNLFTKKKKIPYRSSLFIFDAYGEYHNAFKELHEVVPEIQFKSYTTDIKSNEELVRIPLWLLGVDDIALLLGAEKHSQLLLIEKALKLVTVFARNEDEVLKIKNDIIARAILDILSSGRAPAQIRDQIFSVLSYYNTKELNLETPIFQPGYTRPLKQCIMIDSSGKIREMEMIVDFMETYLTDDYDLSLPDGSFPYTLKDLQDAFDFALISEGVLKSDKIYDEANILKVRLHALVSSDDSEYFNYPKYIDRISYVKQLLTAENGKKSTNYQF